jgi:CHAT domain-containing protein/tetratricopeptide (TPR) repeat protein
MQKILRVGFIAALTAALLVVEPNVGSGQNLGEAEALNRKVTELFSAGKYEEAIPLVQRVLSMGEKTFGPDHPLIATPLNNLAMLYRAQGRYADAEPPFKRSLAIFEKAFGPDHPNVATSLTNLAGLYHLQGRYTDAEALYKRVLGIKEKTLGPDHPDVALSLNNLAGLYQAQGRYADAEPLNRRALAIREKALGSDRPDVAQSLNNLAALHRDQGRYADAEPLYKRSLAIYEKALGPDHTDVATSLNNLAELYEDQGRYADAEPPFKRSLAIFEKAFGPDHPNVATSLNNLATLYVRQGRYADAEPPFKRSLAIFEKAFGPDHPNVATSLTNLAGLYHLQGRYTDAEALYKRALGIKEKTLGPDHPDVALSLNNLAGLYQAQGRFADAEPLYKRSLATYEKALGPDHPAVATSLDNLADIFRMQGRYTDAEPFCKRSMAIREKALGPNHPDVATSLNNLAGLYQEQSRYADAEPLYRRTLAIFEKAFGPDHPNVATSLINLASLYKSQGRYVDALPLVRTTAQKGFYWKNTHLAVLAGAFTTSLITKPAALTESYRIVQQATSSAASNAITQLSVRFAAGSDELAKLVRREQDLSAENERLDKTLIDAVSKEPGKRDAAKEQEMRDRIGVIAAARVQVRTLLIQRFPDYTALSKPQPLTVEQTQALLADDEALILFDFDAQSYAWVITQTNANWVGLKVSAKDLSEQVKSLRSSLTFDIDRPFDTQLAFKIYRQTLGKIADRLQGKRSLSVVTTGALTSLPLQLLITKDPNEKPLKDVDWLVRSYAITNLPSVASLKTLRSTASRPSRQKPMIAFADPVFSDGKTQAVENRRPQGRRTQVASLRSVVNFYEGGQPDLVSLAKALPQLPDTANEVRAIADVLKAEKNDLKLGRSASETTVKQTKLDNYRIVYFATHGLVSGEVEKFAKVKAEPALALTIPDKPSDLDDGLLTASEVAQLKLNSDWVVLSACNTAAEGNPGAEALSGLARAFFYAGARSVVVSHWEVDSEATVELMIGTFQASARYPKVSHAEALQQSMLAMIDSAKSDDDAHPRIWAPFVVVGEPAKGR